MNYILSVSGKTVTLSSGDSTLTPIKALQTLANHKIDNKTLVSTHKVAEEIFEKYDNERSGWTRFWDAIKGFFCIQTEMSRAKDLYEKIISKKDDSSSVPEKKAIDPAVIQQTREKLLTYRENAAKEGVEVSDIRFDDLSNFDKTFEMMSTLEKRCREKRLGASGYVEGQRHMRVNFSQEKPGLRFSRTHIQEVVSTLFEANWNILDFENCFKIWQTVLEDNVYFKNYFCRLFATFANDDKKLTSLFQRFESLNSEAAKYYKTFLLENKDTLALRALKFIGVKVTDSKLELLNGYLQRDQLESAKAVLATFSLDEESAKQQFLREYKGKNSDLVAQYLPKPSNDSVSFLKGIAQEAKRLGVETTPISSDDLKALNILRLEIDHLEPLVDKMDTKLVELSNSAFKTGDYDHSFYLICLVDVTRRKPTSIIESHMTHEMFVGKNAAKFAVLVDKYALARANIQDFIMSSYANLNEHNLDGYLWALKYIAADVTNVRLDLLVKLVNDTDLTRAKLVLDSFKESERGALEIELRESIKDLKEYPTERNVKIIELYEQYLPALVKPLEPPKKTVEHGYFITKLKDNMIKAALLGLDVSDVSFDELNEHDISGILEQLKKFHQKYHKLDQEDKKKFKDIKLNIDSVLFAFYEVKEQSKDPNGCFEVLKLSDGSIEPRKIEQLIHYYFHNNPENTKECLRQLHLADYRSEGLVEKILSEFIEGVLESASNLKDSKNPADAIRGVDFYVERVSEILDGAPIKTDEMQIKLFKALLPINKILAQTALNYIDLSHPQHKEFEQLLKDTK
jgi:hypothetical protein